MVAPIPLDEVDDVAVDQAVHHVAQRAADDQRIRQRLAPVAARGAAQPEGQQAADADGQRGEEPDLPATGAAEETECRAGVVGAKPVPEAFDDRHGGVLGQRGQHPGLGPLVQSDDDGRQQQPDQGIGFGGGRAHGTGRYPDGWSMRVMRAVPGVLPHRCPRAGRLEGYFCRCGFPGGPG